MVMSGRDREQGEIKMKNHKTGFYVWVGGDRYWFRFEERAHAFFQLRASQYGNAVMQLICVETGEILAGEAR